MSDLDDLRAFNAVAEAGGFGRAAARLGLSKSIISRRVAALEADLGASLLLRGARGVTLTEAGETFRQRAERILADLAEAREAVAETREVLAGTLRLALPLAFGLRHMAPLLADLALAHPRLRIEASYSDAFVDLIADRYDAAIRLGTLGDSSLVARRIAPIHGALVASPDYLARRGRPATLDDLSDHDAVIQTGMRQGDTWRLQVGDRSVTIRPQGRMRADNSEAVLQATVAGLGVALLPTFLIAPDIKAGRLEPLLPDLPMPEAGLYVVRPPTGPPSAKVRALTDLMVERFGGEPYWDSCALHRRNQRDNA
ncbi:MAG: LysR family transcriptional regulator [Caulobacter sp.]